MDCHEGSSQTIYGYCVDPSLCTQLPNFKTLYFIYEYLF